MSIRVIIVDDEDDARELLKIHLQRHQQIDVVGEATNGQEAIAQITSQQPDLIFLDIQMPELSGLEVVEQISNTPQVIFITAYDEFAVSAFELHALDYLLKPFSEKRFDEAVGRAIDQLTRGENPQDLYLALLEELKGDHRTKYLNRLSYKQGLKTILVDVEDILFIEAADQYVEVHTVEKTHLIRQSMDFLEERLEPNTFFRTHRSAIVRLSEVSSLEQYEPKNALVHLKSGKKVKLSQSRKLLFQSKLGL